MPQRLKLWWHWRYEWRRTEGIVIPMILQHEINKILTLMAELLGFPALFEEKWVPLHSQTHAEPLWNEVERLQGGSTTFWKCVADALFWRFETSTNEW
jgi:hypothetical protein